MMRIKICGITRISDAECVRDAGADAIGMVFYGPSPRNVSDLGLAREIAQAAGPFVTVVALFVDETPEQIERVLSQVPVNLLQFHGNEDEAFCAGFSRPYIKALRMKDKLDVSASIAQYSSATGILLDSYKAGVPGGTGETFQWEKIPPNLSKPLVLAGGLNPENVTEACASVRPYAVDVSGGVESAAGIKSEEKVRAFIAAARG